MHAPAGIVEVDGLGFRTCGGDADTPTLEAPSGARVTLRPWTLAAHLAACEAAVRVEGGRLRFAADAFAAAVLRHCGAPPDRFAELAPLALWWAAGQPAPDSDRPTPSAEPDADGWLALTRGRARVRPWTWAERCAAVERCLVPGTDQDVRLTPYLAAMLRASVVAAEHVDLDALAGADAQRLLAAVIAANEPQGPMDAAVAAGDGRLAADTLRLCRAFGWTPSQVWAMPAAEAQRLLALLDRVAPAPAPPATSATTGSTGSRPRSVPTSRLAAHPDAVIIRVEDDA